MIIQVAVSQPSALAKWTYHLDTIYKSYEGLKL